VEYNGKPVVKIPTGTKVHPAKWNPEKERPIGGLKGLESAEANAIIEKLATVKATVESEYRNYVNKYQSYLLERLKSSVLDSAGVRDYNIKAIIADLNAQRKMRPQLGNAVGHTVLSWSNEDRDKLTEQKMAEHAREYMKKMGIKNTQYVTVLHKDKKHPHG